MSATILSHSPRFVNSPPGPLTKTPQRTLVNPRAIPRELRQYRQFVCWKYVQTGKPKPDKIPVNPKTLGNAGTGWPNSWADLRTAAQVYKDNPHLLSGIGFVLTQHDPFTMIDLDGCLFGGEPNPLANEVLGTLNTYAEISPSGRGLRLFVRCRTPHTLKTPAVEIYSSQRFATLTGHVFADLLVPDLPIAAVDNLTWLIDLVTPVKKNAGSPTLYPHSCSSPDDDHLWAQIFDRNRLAYELARGNLESARGDFSRAVTLLLNALAAATGCDAARMARLIRQTALDQTKFDRPCGAVTWLDYQIQNAINFTCGATR